MKAPQQLEVTEWIAPPVDIAPAEARSSVEVWIPRAIGGLAVLAVHALLLLSLNAATAVLPARAGMNGSADDGSLVITFIDKPIRAEELFPDGVKPVLVPPTSMPLALEPPPALRDRLTLGEDSTPEGRADPALSEANAIYSRQINARVSRLWEQPSSKGVAQKGTQGFECTVQLEQDADGNVKEVLLQKCNGSAAWRQSLLAAIRSASPLPAPPDRRVFQSSLVLAFAASDISGDQTGTAPAH